MIQKAIEFGAETLTVPFELVEHMKDRMAESANKNMEAGQVAKIYLVWFSTWWAKSDGYFNFAWDKEVGTRQFVQFRDNDNASE